MWRRRRNSLSSSDCGQTLTWYRNNSKSKGSALVFSIALNSLIGMPILAFKFNFPLHAICVFLYLEGATMYAAAAVRDGELAMTERRGQQQQQRKKLELNLFHINWKISKINFLANVVRAAEGGCTRWRDEEIERNCYAFNGAKMKEEEERQISIPIIHLAVACGWHSLFLASSFHLFNQVLNQIRSNLFLFTLSDCQSFEPDGAHFFCVGMSALIIKNTTADDKKTRRETLMMWGNMCGVRCVPTMTTTTTKW